MINTKKELNFFINEDKKNAGRNHNPLYIGDEIGKYLLFLRKKEYAYNLSKRSLIQKIHYFYLKYRQHHLGVKLGFNIPINSIGPGFRIDHWGFLAINGYAKIGKNCHIYGDVTIGVKNKNDKTAPIIGDNVEIGTGARIIGPITIASDCKIGANACVTHSILEKGKTVVGVPAHEIN